MSLRKCLFLSLFRGKTTERNISEKDIFLKKRDIFKKTFPNHKARESSESRIKQREIEKKRHFSKKQNFVYLSRIGSIFCFNNEDPSD